MEAQISAGYFEEDEEEDVVLLSMIFHFTCCAIWIACLCAVSDFPRWKSFELFHLEYLW